MEFDLLGWPPEGPTLRLDHRQFAYAGKFVMSNTGKAVIRESDGDRRPSSPEPATGSEFDTDVLAALAFDADRTDETTLRYRYITVRSDTRGSELGPRLAAFVAPRADDQGYDRIAIAVNNPFAYEAMYKAGFEWTGEESGLAELVLERPSTPPAVTQSTPRTETYQAGLDRYRSRDLGDPEATFLAERVGAEPPELIRADGVRAESSAPVVERDEADPGRNDLDCQDLNCEDLDLEDLDPADLDREDLDPENLDPDD